MKKMNMVRDFVKSDGSNKMGLSIRLVCPVICAVMSLLLINIFVLSISSCGRAVKASD